VAASASGAAPGLAEEVAALRAAHDALGKGQSQRCLDAVNAYFAAFPGGHLSAEARYLRVEALFAGGQRAEASSLARSMLTANPRSPYAARLRTIAGDPAP
jgi:TolA-binding protein